MGAGIAETLAMAGFTVEMLDTSEAIVRDAQAAIAERLDGRVARGIMSRTERDAIASRLRVAGGYDSFKDAECVIETVPEDLKLKQHILGELDKILSPRTLLATNTSSLSISKIGDALMCGDRFLGMHFFNPAPVMKLVELVQGPATSEQTMVNARAICAKLQKTAVKVKDSPGFIGNRVNRPFYLESLRLVETGEADIRTVDRAMKRIGGFRAGPFELLDMIGLDVNLRVTETLYEDFDRSPLFAPSDIQYKLVAAGRLGRKTGGGFYDYSDDSPTPAYERPLKDAQSWQAAPALVEFAKAFGKPADRDMWIFARIYLAVVNEAARVADTIALPRAVNLTMELGFNYPTGPLAMADHIGLDVVRQLLADFHRETDGDERYKANPLLDRHVADGNLGEETARGFLHHSL